MRVNHTRTPNSTVSEYYYSKIAVAVFRFGESRTQRRRTKVDTCVLQTQHVILRTQHVKCRIVIVKLMIVGADGEVTIQGSAGTNPPLDPTEGVCLGPRGSRSMGHGGNQPRAPLYRATSLLINQPPKGPYSRNMPRPSGGRSMAASTALKGYLAGKRPIPHRTLQWEYA